MRIRKGSIIAYGTAFLSSAALFALAIFFIISGALPGAQGIFAASSLFFLALASLAQGLLLLIRGARLSRLLGWLEDAQKNILLSGKPPFYKGDDEISRATAHIENILSGSRAKASRYIDVLDIIPAATLEVDGGLRVVFSNKAASDLTGYGKEELLGKPFPELLGEESRPLFQKLFETITGGSVTGFELPIRTKGGRINHTELRGTPLRDGEKVTGVVLALRDIDEVKKIRDELSELKRRAQESSQKLKDNIKELEEFALMAVKRELKMKEIRESLRKFMEEEVRH